MCLFYFYTYCGRRWILDALPVVGTTAALRLIKEKFQANELTVPELTQALLVALHMVTANQDSIQLTAVSKNLSYPVF